jgi:hypothetical protein
MHNKLLTAFEIIRQIENWPHPRAVIMVENIFSLEKARLIDEPKWVKAGEGYLHWRHSTNADGKSKNPFGSRSGPQGLKLLNTKLARRRS